MWNNTLGSSKVTTPALASGRCSPCPVSTDGVSTVFTADASGAQLNFDEETTLQLGQPIMGPLTVESVGSTLFALTPPMPPWPPLPPLSSMQIAATVASSVAIADGPTAAAASVASGFSFTVVSTPCVLISSYVQSISPSEAEQTALSLGVAASVAHVPYQMAPGLVVYFILRPNVSALASTVPNAVPIDAIAVTLFAPSGSSPTVLQLTQAVGVIGNQLAVATDDVEIRSGSAGPPVVARESMMVLWVLVGFAVLLLVVAVLLRSLPKKTTHVKPKSQLAGYTPRAGAAPVHRNLVL